MKTFKKHHIVSILLLITTLLACGENQNNQQNFPPTIQNLQFIDVNGGTIEKTDLIQVQYDYYDQDEDMEDTPEIYWERDGNAVAIGTGLQYTISASDRGSVITLKIRPRAKTGNNNSYFYEEELSIPTVSANDRWRKQILTISESEQYDILTGFNGPFGISIHDNNIYISDIWDRKIIKFTANLKFDASLGFSFSERKMGWYEDTESEASQLPEESALGILSGPHSVSFWNKKTYVADYFGGTVNVFDENGDFSHYLETNDEQAVFKGPANIYIDPNGTSYVSDWNGNQIFIFDRFENYIGWIGESNDNKDLIKLTGTAERSVLLGGFYKPHMVTKDSEGYLYIVDQGNHRIQKFSHDYTPLGWIGFHPDKNTYSGWRTDLAPVNTDDIRGFDNPVSIETHNDWLIIVDSGNHRILRYSLNGIFDGWIGGTNDMPILDWNYGGISETVNYENAFFKAPYDAKMMLGSIVIADGHKKRIVLLDNK
jgi:hypothetical protein